jgi:hypothetical protein
MMMEPSRGHDETLVPPLSPDVLASPAYAASMQVRIPAEFWAELKERDGLGGLAQRELQIK